MNGDVGCSQNGHFDRIISRDEATKCVMECHDVCSAMECQLM